MLHLQSPRSSQPSSVLPSNSEIHAGQIGGLTANQPNGTLRVAGVRGRADPLSDMAVSLPIPLAAQSDQCWQALGEQAGATSGQLPSDDQLDGTIRQPRIRRASCR